MDTHSFDQQPPFGYRSVTTLGEIHCCKPLHDPHSLLQPLKASVAVFPPRLKARIVQDMLWGAEFSFRFAWDFARSGDVPNTTACMTRIFHYLVQALFALNETYFMNDKRVLSEIDGFTCRPADFGARMSAILAAPGSDTLPALEVLFYETVALSGREYIPKFILP